jgi:alpha-D-ribose 1-methylphosphonate 5-triphosphate synthase subunit PhnG
VTYDEVIAYLEARVQKWHEVRKRETAAGRVDSFLARYAAACQGELMLVVSELTR